MSAADPQWPAGAASCGVACWQGWGRTRLWASFVVSLATPAVRLVPQRQGRARLPLSLGTPAPLRPLRESTSGRAVLVGSLRGAVNAPGVMVGVRVSLPAAIRETVMAAASSLRHVPYAGPALCCGDDCEPCGGPVIPHAVWEEDTPLGNVAATTPLSQHGAVAPSQHDYRARRLLGRLGRGMRGGRRPRDLPRAQDGTDDRKKPLSQYMLTCLLTLAGAAFVVPSAGASTRPVVLVERHSAHALFCVGLTSAKDAAVTWVGETGSVLCTCFESSEDAAVYGTGGRSCTCAHARALSTALQLAPPPARSNKGCPKFCVRIRRGPSSDAVVVWDGAIFSVVTVLDGAADLCLAPGCRVAPHQCGHVKAAREEIARAKLSQVQNKPLCNPEDALAAAMLQVDGVDDLYQSDSDNFFIAQQIELENGSNPPEHPPSEGESAAAGAPVGASCGSVPPAASNDREGWSLTQPATRNMEPCKNEVAMSNKWAYTAELINRANALGGAHIDLHQQAVERNEAYDVSKTLVEPACPNCNALSPADVSKVFPDAAVLTTSSRSAGPITVTVGNWECAPCRKMVVFDGAQCSLFVLPEVDADKRLAVFTREVCDDLLSFVVNSRSSFSCATRHWARTLPSLFYRRQTLISLGRQYLEVLDIPAKIFMCPHCKENPNVIIMDGQALGFKIPKNWEVLRHAINAPVLPIPLSGMTIFTSLSQTDLVQRITRNSTELATKEATAGTTLMYKLALGVLTPAQEAAVVAMAFFFPLDAISGDILRRRPAASQDEQVPDGLILSPAQRQLLAAHLSCAGTLAAVDGAAVANEEEAAENLLEVDDEDVGAEENDLEEDDRSADDGEGVETASSGEETEGAGHGRGPVPPTTELGRGRRGAKKDKAISHPWDERTGSFAPRFDVIERDDVPTLTSIRWFLRAMIGEPVVNILVSCDVEEVQTLIKALRAPNHLAWRSEMQAVDDVAFVSHCLSRVAPVLDAYRSLRLAVAALLEYCLQVEKDVDDTFYAAAEKYSKLGKGYNQEYCEMWRDTSPDKFAEYASSIGMERLIIDDANASMEFFPLLKRCRPGIWDRMAATRRTAYAVGQKRKRTSASAAREDMADNCNKDFPTDSRLTPGVYNVLCPHVISYGFRVLTKAESVEDGISIILERFPFLPKTIYYDMACKMNRNLMRRVRPLFRHFSVRCFMDRPHGKGHTCSLSNFADASLRQTLGSASTAAESSHSIAVRFRPMLAYMKPATFLRLKSFQVATANLRAIYRLKSPNALKESDHVNFRNFFWQSISSRCLVQGCPCANESAQ